MPDLADSASCLEAGSPAGKLTRTQSSFLHRQPALLPPLPERGGIRKARYQLAHFALNQLLNVLGCTALNGKEKIKS